MQKYYYRSIQSIAERGGGEVENREEKGIGGGRRLVEGTVRVVGGEEDDDTIRDDH